MLPLHSQKQKQLYLVRWMRGLVNGLQNRVHPFESGTHLKKNNKKRQAQLADAGWAILITKDLTGCRWVLQVRVGDDWI